MGIRVSTAQTRKRVALVQKALQKAETEATTELADELAVRIRRDAPVDTGRLRDSVDSLQGRVIIGVDYAIYVSRTNPFITQNLETIEREADRIVQEAIERRLP